MKLNTRNTMLITYILVGLIPVVVIFVLNWMIISSIESQNCEILLEDALKESLAYLKHDNVILELGIENLSYELKSHITYNKSKNINKYLKELEIKHKLNFIYLLDNNYNVIAQSNTNVKEKLTHPEYSKTALKGVTTVSLEVLSNKLLNPEKYQQIVNDKRCTFSTLKNDSLQNICLPKEIYRVAYSPLRLDKDKPENVTGIIYAGQSFSKDMSVLSKAIENLFDVSLGILPVDHPLKPSRFHKYKMLQDFKGKPLGNFIIVLDHQNYSKMLMNTQLSIFTVLIISFVLMLFVSLIMSNIMVRPMKKLHEATQEISKENFNIQVDNKGPQEFIDLTNSFNSMASELSIRRRTQEDFIATLAHDMRVPLLAEKKAINLLINYDQFKLSNDQVEILKNMLLSNDTLLNLVNNLLMTYKLESGMHKLNISTHNMVKLIKDTIIELKPLADEKQQKLSFEPSFDELTVEMDHQYIKRVIINLIGNSINYTHKNGEISINLSMNDNDLVFSVNDNGCGISEEEKRNLFKRYSTGSKKLKNVGTGLGLYLCNLIIQEHEGKIWFESEVNKGSTFYFSLPLNKKV